MALAAGTILGQCEIRSPLGAGGMGEVYRAHDTRLNREVAIKVLPESVSSDPERLRRFEQEARAAAALNHPNILAVYQMATHEGVSVSYTHLDVYKRQLWDHITSPETEPTSRWYSNSRTFAEPMNEAMQMTTAQAVGAASHTFCGLYPLPCELAASPYRVGLICT